jgi:osmotically-inducible protein OsmY
MQEHGLRIAAAGGTSMGWSLAWQTDTQLHDSVQRELEWDPEINAHDIAVIAADGVITLTGTASSYAAKLAAEQSVKRVRGVRGVANEIQVVPLNERTDSQLAKEAVHALRAHATVPTNVIVTVQNGVVALEGTVQWMFQRTAAAAAVSDLVGVKGVLNQIVVRPDVFVGRVKDDIDAALHRCAAVDAQHISVSIAGTAVTLSGVVSSWHERQEAERAAWSAAGVTRVDNLVTVGSRETRDALGGSTSSTRVF